MQQEKAQSLNALQSERKRQRGQMEGANARAVASEGELTTLRKSLTALQKDLQACRQAAAQRQSVVQVCAQRNRPARVHPYLGQSLPYDQLEGKSLPYKGFV